MAASIFFTALPWLGFALGFWRLVARIGVHEPTTTFVVDANAPNAAPVEAIVEDAALGEHERRMSAVRAAQAGTGPGRTPSAPRHSDRAGRRSASFPARARSGSADADAGACRTRANRGRLRPSVEPHSMAHERAGALTYDEDVPPFTMSTSDDFGRHTIGRDLKNWRARYGLDVQFSGGFKGVRSFRD